MRGRCYLIHEGAVQEVCPGLNFHFRAWSDDRDMCIAAERLPLVRLPLGHTKALLQLERLTAADPQAQVVYRDDVHEFDLVTTAERASRHVNARIERARQGRLSAREVAARLAPLTGYTREEAWRQVLDAVRLGRLKFFDLPGGIEIRPERLAHHFGDSSAAYVLSEVVGEVRAYTRTELVNEWLRQHSDGVRLTGVGSLGAGAIEGAAEARPIVHRTQGGRQPDALWLVIERAREEAASELPGPIWAHLEALARSPAPPPPLAGVTSGGIQYKLGGRVKTFTRKAFGERLRRRA